MKNAVTKEEQIRALVPLGLEFAVPVSIAYFLEHEHLALILMSELDNFVLNFFFK